jgi:hypothetical protein
MGYISLAVVAFLGAYVVTMQTSPTGIGFFILAWNLIEFGLVYLFGSILLTSLLFRIPATYGLGGATVAMVIGLIFSFQTHPYRYGSFSVIFVAFQSLAISGSTALSVLALRRYKQRAADDRKFTQSQSDVQE